MTGAPGGSGSGSWGMHRRTVRQVGGLATVTAIGALAWAGGIGAPPAAWSQVLDCLIEPNTVVTVSSPVEGVVEKLHVDRGDLVKQNQILATLESSVQKAEVQIARARTEMEAGLKTGRARTDYSQGKFGRAKELFTKENISVNELEEAKVENLLAEASLLEAVESTRLAQLELQRATAALALRTIRSPVTGVVVEQLVSQGEYRNSNEHTLYKLAEIDPLRVEVFAPVALLGRIRAGMKATVVPEPPESTPRTARVTVVDRVVDAASGTFGVRLLLPNSGYGLPAGLKCKVDFHLK